MHHSCWPCHPHRCTTHITQFRCINCVEWIIHVSTSPSSAHTHRSFVKITRFGGSLMLAHRLRQGITHIMGLYPHTRFGTSPTLTDNSRRRTTHAGTSPTSVVDQNIACRRRRFYELTGHYPHSITVVSYLLKKERFVTLHRQAVGFPLERFDFVGTPVRCCFNCCYRRCCCCHAPPSSRHDANLLRTHAYSWVLNRACVKSTSRKSASPL